MSTRDLAIYCLRRMGGNYTLLYVLCNSSTKTHPLTYFFLLFVFAHFYYFLDDSGYAAFSRFLFFFVFENCPILSDIYDGNLLCSCFVSGIDGNKRLDGRSIGRGPWAMI